MQFILFSCLLHLVVTPYYLLIEVCNVGYLPFIFLEIIWIVLHLVRLMIIVETCQRCIDEVKKRNSKNIFLTSFLVSRDYKFSSETLNKSFASGYKGTSRNFGCTSLK